VIDHYRVLGVSPIATRDDIHKAFLRLAVRYNTDRNKETGTQARLSKITEAHEVLFDPARRSPYDFQVWKTPN
jgi:curved DNA-binding protein CbpA